VVGQTSDWEAWLSSPLRTDLASRISDAVCFRSVTFRGAQVVASDAVRVSLETMLMPAISHSTGTSLRPVLSQGPLYARIYTELRDCKCLSLITHARRP